jgi:hypothetical protein
MLGLKIVTIIVAGMTLLVTSCNNANENANTNTNANTAAVNANSPVPVANNNANADPNATRPGGMTRADYEKNKAKYDQEAKSSGRKVGTGVSDGWLWVKTRYELAAADDLRDSTINVDLENGIATLTGTVPTAAQKARAEAITKAVEGVTSVKNMLKVAPTKPAASPTPVKK